MFEIKYSIKNGNCVIVLLFKGSEQEPVNVKSSERAGKASAVPAPTPPTTKISSFYALGMTRTRNVI